MELYQKLDKDRHDIRVLYLLGDPFRPGLPLRCKFSIIPEHDQPNACQYGALSYVWGVEDASEEISVNGINIRIRFNLYQALCQIWTREPDTAVWVDAVCINQNDLAEKADQVQMMHSIYSNAKHVWVWLGEKEPSTHLAWAVISSLIGADDIEEREEDEFALALNDLGTRAWYSRAWTFQEIVLARDAFVLCGNFILRWDDFAATLLRLTTKSRRRKKVCSELVNNLELLQRASRLRQIAPISWMNLIVSNRYRRASDPRDKIYALLGMPQVRGQVLIPASYTCSVAVVYAKAAHYCIQHSRKLRVLRGAGLRFSSLIPQSFCSSKDHSVLSSTMDQKSDGAEVLLEQAPADKLDWPSWVPNWNDSVIVERLQMDYPYGLRTDLQASVRASAVIGSPRDDMRIELGGVALGVLTQSNHTGGLNVASFPICLGTRISRPEDEGTLNRVDLDLKACLPLREDLEDQSSTAQGQGQGHGKEYSMSQMYMQKAMQQLKVHETQTCSCFPSAKRVRNRVLKVNSVPYNAWPTNSDPEYLKRNDLVCLLHGSHDLYILRLERPRLRTSEDKNGADLPIHFNLVTTLTVHENEDAKLFVTNSTRFETTFILS